MTSVLNVDTIAAKNGTDPVTLTKQSAAKAWSLINQTSTQAVLSSFNVSSIADDGTGATKIYFVNAFSNSNYSHTNGLQRVGTSDFVNTGYDSNTTDSEVEMWSGGSPADSSKLASSIHGDLA